MNCQYQMSDGVCGQPIVKDAHSYSGYSHEHKADWLHWATPVPYGPQGENSGNPAMEKVFKRCVVCNLRGPDNPAHVKYAEFGGHKFVARED